jgi:hypothetical protein
VASCAIAGPTGAAASLKITNSHLLATCVDGTPIAAGRRRWEPIAPITLTLTMRNEPRPGIENADPGLAVITFTPEAGHKYEIEVQAAATANSTRVWPRGEWTPTVRDRTSNRVVSDNPRWVASGCR